MEKIKKIITADNLLSFFIIICPILDIASYVFRNKFNTSYSISTFLRPVITLLVFTYIFFKEKNKSKIKITVVSAMYFLYALIHLLIYKKMMVGCTYGTILHEAQYLVNYTFMILNLFVFMKVFNKDNKKKLQNSVAISLAIYITTIYISIITGISSTTYIEGIGFKGLFESGNSISAIFVLGLFILMSFIMKVDNKIYKCCMFAILVSVGIFLMTLIGTRVGLIGFIVVVLCFVISQIFEKFITKVKLNKKNFIVLSAILALLIIVVITAGSVTMQRRRHLQNMENTIIDESTGEVSNLTGDLTKIRNKIINNSLEDNFMTEQQKQSVLDLYDIAKKQNISNTNRRIQQLIYHTMLIKNQKNIALILFGNGYLINTNELVLEMECPAILLNFGLLGFTCYMVPFIANLSYAFITILKKIKKVDYELIMLFFGVGLSFIISTLSGYTFFNSSSMIIIIVANVLLKIKVEMLKE